MMELLGTAVRYAFLFFGSWYGFTGNALESFAGFGMSAFAVLWFMYKEGHFGKMWNKVKAWF